MTASPPIPILDLEPELSEVSVELDAAWRRVVTSGHFILGPEVEGLEREIAGYLGVRHAVSVNSGTDALVLGLRALGIGPGHEVVTSPFTFFATSESIDTVGATPVFVDIDPETYTLRPDLLARVIGPRTRAIIPVHLFGHAADMEPILELAHSRGLAILEDVAQALGGSIGGRKLGSLGSAGAFSFFPSKNLGGLGDGGLVTTDDAAVADRVRMLRGHGSRRKYFNEVTGYNSRLDALQAAFLRAKLPRLDTWNGLRREAAARYRDLLAGIPGISLPIERIGVHHVYHQFTIRVRYGRRDAMQAALGAAGIATMVYYPKGLHELPVYAGRFGSFPEVEVATQEVLSLPFWPRIPAAIQERVAIAIQQFQRP